MCGVLQGWRVVHDAGLTSESGAQQQNMMEKVGNECPLTVTVMVLGCPDYLH
jgi:hypothetical protein